MADITFIYSTDTFKEAAINNGAIANGITIKIANGTFAGDNGDSLLIKDEFGDIVNVVGTPEGLTPVLVKTSATTARLTFEGTAKNHETANDITLAGKGLELWFDDFMFATGTTGSFASNKFLAIDFNNKVTTGLTLVPEAGADTTAFYTAGNTKTGAKDNLPTIGGVGTKGETLYFYSNDKILDKTITTKVGDTGEWTYDLSGLASKFKDGTHIVTVSTSADGKGVMSNPFAFTVDSKAPAVPSVTAVKGAISDTTPVLTGKAEKDATVKVYSSDDQVDPTLDKSGNVTNSDKVTLLGTTKADAKGLWTLAVDSSNTLLAKDGGYKISAKAIDAAGNATVSKTQTKDNLTIDTKIADSTLVLDAKSKGNSVTLTGKVEGETGGTVQLYGGADGSVALGKAAKIGKEGTWKITVKLSEGDHDLNVIATDAAGNVSASAVLEKTIDTATAVPTLELAETEGKDWVTMHGTAEAGATVTVKNGTATLGETKADSTGKWVLDTSAITAPTKDGTAKLTAIAKDTAGNISKASSPADEFKVNTKFEDKAAPTLLFAETSADGKSVVLTYSQALATATAAKTAYDVTVGTTKDIEPASVTSSGAKVTLTLTDAVKAGETVKVTYTAPGAETTVKADDLAIQDKAGNNAVAFTDKAVTNLVPATEGGGGGGDVTAPTISAFTVATATTLTFKSSEAGTAGLYNDTGNALITGTDKTVVADTATTITVAAQDDTGMTTASLKVADAVPNTATSPIKVLLGTSGNDGGSAFTVGAGDQYIFTFGGNDGVTLTSAAASGRVIADFTAGGDYIVLTADAFVGITDNAGALQASDFASGAGKVAAASATEFIIYDTDTGNLYYDAEGNTGAAAVLIAKLVGAPEVTAGDFNVV